MPHMDIPGLARSMGQFSFEDRPFVIKRLMRRGFGQLSGIIMEADDGLDSMLLISFAGTASAWDLSHGPYIQSSMDIGGDGIHSGVASMALHHQEELLEHILPRIGTEPLRIILTGHSLGGSIATLVLYLLKRRLGSKLHGSCLTFASPSVIRKHAKEALIDVAGYGNMLNIMRKSDYVLQWSGYLGFDLAGPVLSLPSHEEDWSGTPSLAQMWEHFLRNHAVEHYIEDLRNGNLQAWHDQQQLSELINLEAQITKLIAEIAADLHALDPIYPTRGRHE